jgi:hypothetical protein
MLGSSLGRREAVAVTLGRREAVWARPQLQQYASAAPALQDIALPSQFLGRREAVAVTLGRRESVKATLGSAQPRHQQRASPSPSHALKNTTLAKHPAAYLRRRETVMALSFGGDASYYNGGVQSALQRIEIPVIALTKK